MITQQTSAKRSSNDAPPRSDVSGSGHLRTITDHNRRQRKGATTTRRPDQTSAPEERRCCSVTLATTASACSRARRLSSATLEVRCSCSPPCRPDTVDTGVTPLPRPPTPDTCGSEEAPRVDTPETPPGTVKAGDCWGKGARGLQHRQKGRQPANRQSV